MTTLSSISYNADTAWNEITAAIASNFLVGCDTSSSTKYGLPASHAYTVMGAYTLKDTAGNVVQRLYRVRNPWGTDAAFSGSWKDTSSNWSDAYKAQVPYDRNTADGAFFITDSEFVNSYYYYQVGYVHDNYAHSYYS